MANLFFKKSALALILGGALSANVYAATVNDASKNPPQTATAFTAEDFSDIDYRIIDDTTLLTLARSGDSIAAFNVGGRYYHGASTLKRSYKKAFYWYKKSAELGNVDGEFSLGVCYLEGIGTARDYKKAYYWFNKADKADHTLATLALGRLYESGRGVTKDLSKAFSYYEKAADAGNLRARTLVGKAYFNGLGVPENRAKGLAILKETADIGDRESRKFLDLIERNAKANATANATTAAKSADKTASPSVSATNKPATNTSASAAAKAATPKTTTAEAPSTTTKNTATKATPATDAQRQDNPEQKQNADAPNLSPNSIRKVTSVTTTPNQG